MDGNRDREQVRRAGTGGCRAELCDRGWGDILVLASPGSNEPDVGVGISAALQMKDRRQVRGGRGTGGSGAGGAGGTGCGRRDGATAIVGNSPACRPQAEVYLGSKPFHFHDIVYYAFAFVTRSADWLCRCSRLFNSD